MAEKAMNLAEIADRYGISESKLRIEVINNIALKEDLKKAGFTYGNQRLFFGRQIDIIENHFGKFPPETFKNR